jgi:hypothetical protein
MKHHVFCLGFYTDRHKTLEAILSLNKKPRPLEEETGLCKPVKLPSCTVMWDGTVSTVIHVVRLLSQSFFESYR